MRVMLVVREVDRATEIAKAGGADAETHAAGVPLRNFLSQMAKQNGFVNVPLPAGPLSHVGRSLSTEDPDLVLNSSSVAPGVRYKVVSPQIVQVSLDQWKDRDPDDTWLSIGWEVKLTEEEQKVARS